MRCSKCRARSMFQTHPRSAFPPVLLAPGTASTIPHRMFLFTELRQPGALCGPPPVRGLRSAGRGHTHVPQRLPTSANVTAHLHLQQADAGTQPLGKGNLFCPWHSSRRGSSLKASEMYLFTEHTWSQARPAPRAQPHQGREEPRDISSLQQVEARNKDDVSCHLRNTLSYRVK